MTRWTEEMTSIWRHYDGDILRMWHAYRRVYAAQGEQGASTVDWAHADRIREVMRWVECFGEPPVTLAEVA